MGDADAPPEPGVDHAGTVLLSETLRLEPPPEGGFGRTAGRLLQIDEPGVLALTVWTFGDARFSNLEVRACPEAGSECTRLTAIGREPGLAWLPDRYHHTVETLDSVRLELYLATSDDVPLDAFVRVARMPWTEQASSADDHTLTLSLRSQSAHRGDATPPYRWYRFDAPLAGLLRIVPQSGTDVIVCDPALWGGIPTMCAGQHTSPARRSLRILDAGAYYVVLRASQGNAAYRFLAFFDPDPSAEPCPASEHSDGAGGCSAQDACAAGHHDGGTGRCVPDATCEPFFQLRTDGRCEGWLGDGPYLGDTTNDDLVVFPDGHIVRAGYVFGTPTATRTIYVRKPAGTWSIGTSLSPDYDAGRRFCPAADNRLIVVEYDGYVLSPPRRTDRIYDVSTDTWTEFETPGYAWTRPTCVLLASGKTFVWESGRAALFDPTTLSWTTVAGLTNSQDPTGLEVKPGLVVSAAHPIDTSLSPIRSIALWSESAPSWTESSAWPDAVARPSDASWFVPYDDGVLVFSGESSNGATSDRIYHYDLIGDTWTERGVMPEAFTPSGLAFDEDRALLAWAGSAGPFTFYDLDDGTWHPLPSIATPLWGSSRRVVHTPDGTFVVVWSSPVRLHIGR